jgi:hypothetical protein
MVAHKNFYPPAGEVVDTTNPRVQWNGHDWMLNGKKYKVPSSHHLNGRPGGSLAGWYYDWHDKAWMEPSAPAGMTPPRPPAAPARPPQQPRPPQPPPQVQPQSAPQPPARQPEKEEWKHMEKSKTILEDLIKHPVAPVVGGLLLVASYITDEPTPPTIPATLPEEVQKQWQMVFNQNQQRFERRMTMYRDLANLFLGYTGARSVVDVIGARAMLGDHK